MEIKNNNNKQEMFGSNSKGQIRLGIGDSIEMRMEERVIYFELIWREESGGTGIVIPSCNTKDTETFRLVPCPGYCK